MKKSKFANAQDILDSDDEFPMEYFEEMITPTYKNDHRFDMIQFKWINNSTVPKTAKTEPTKSPIKESTKEIEGKSINIPIINKGILSKNDLFCLKSLEGYGDTTLIWFINFLIKKDLQSNYIFLRSCLVSKYLCDKILISEKKNCFNKTDNLYTVRY